MKISSLGNATAAVSQSVWESFIELQSRGGAARHPKAALFIGPLVMVGRPKFYICRHCNSPPSLSVNRDYLKESAYA